MDSRGDTEDNKVVWSEGMFLRAQHFQQFDRYVERLVRARCEALHGYGWGFLGLQIDEGLLHSGKVALTSAAGVLRDGTPFATPGDTGLPLPLVPPEGTRDTIVYLALPERQSGRPDIAHAGADGTALTRYASGEYDARDTVADSATVARIAVGRLRLRLMLGSEDLSGYTTLGVARIREVKGGGGITLDNGYMPPGVTCAALPPLRRYLGKLSGVVAQRAQALADRLRQPGAGGAAEISDFLLLQLYNRYSPLLAHHAAEALLHPEALYGLMLQMAGELATFTILPDRLPGKLPAYHHDDPQRSFAPLMAALDQALSMVHERSAVAIALQDRGYGIRVAKLEDRTLLDSADFVLAVKADMAAERLRRTLPAQIKVGPPEKIRDLVMSALPGIGISFRPVAPRQIPYSVGTAYFELDRGGAMWRDLGASGSLAFHLSGDFPNIVMELWAIRGDQR